MIWQKSDLDASEQQKIWGEVLNVIFCTTISFRGGRAFSKQLWNQFLLYFLDDDDDDDDDDDEDDDDDDDYDEDDDDDDDDDEIRVERERCQMAVAK